jgi:1-acyl-sn-glycerol-3-phosphate acyltransferase
LRLRGALSLFTVAILFLVTDLIQRIIVAGMVRLRPGSRDQILCGWMRLLARLSLRTAVQAIGGARIETIPVLEGRPGTLILMNHQSLLDIPLAALAVRDRAPLIVTRRRYARGIPLVSHMLRLYDMPLVDPGSRTRDQFDRLVEVARTAERPLLLFPEGHRTRDGEIRPFKKGGLEAILAQRSWQTYLFVADGFWRCGRLADYVARIGSVRGKMRCLGPFTFDAATESAADFSERMRTEMVEGLAALRAETGGPS